MLVNGVYMPNITCTKCRFRHPAGLTCKAAAEAAAANRAEEKRAEIKHFSDFNESKSMLLYLEFDKTADPNWTNSEYIIAFGAYVIQKTEEGLG
jgi:hypothetical protein